MPPRSRRELIRAAADVQTTQQARITAQAARITKLIQFLEFKGLVDEFNEWEGESS